MRGWLACLAIVAAAGAAADIAGWDFSDTRGWDAPVEAVLARYGFDGFRIQGLGGGSAHNRWPGKVPGTNVTETMSAYEPLMAKFLKAFESHFREKLAREIERQIGLIYPVRDK